MTHECGELRRLLPGLVDDAIGSTLHRRVQRQLKRCPECAHEARALRRTRELLGSLPPLRLDARTRAALLRRFREAGFQSQLPTDRHTSA
jgi:anti-sigma factor RsiW